MNLPISIRLLLAASLLTVSPAFAEDYDVVILNGRVIDPETKLDAVRNIGVKDGKILVITEDAIKGKEAIDAKGHVVAPGFIDMHHHNAAAPFGQRLALRDGVTTAMELEAGVYPVNQWYEKLEGKSQTNFGATVGTIPVRERVMNPDYKSVYDGVILYDAQVPDETHISSAWTTQVATEEEFNKIRELLEEGLEQGAIGVGHAPGYMVAGSTQQESNAAQELAGKYGRTVFLHGRYSSQMPPASGLLGMAELMAPQAAYGGGLVVQHLHAQMLDLTPKALELVDAARKSGINVIAEIYPYDYGATIVGADYLVPDNYQPNMGRDYKDIIETGTMKPLTKERYDELKKTAPLTSVMFYNAKEQTVYDALAHPGTVIGSDAFAYTLKATGGPAYDWDTPFDAVLGHPRGAGAHARFLRLVREKKVDIPLIEAVSKMTFLIADFLAGNGVDQMAKKGRVQVGCDADLVVFDPAEVRDNATMEQGALPSSGIPWVLVNGTVVVKESKTLKGVNPGKPVRCDRP